MSLQQIKHVLTNPHLWPADFEWNYAQWETCAGGLCEQLGILEKPYATTLLNEEYQAEELGISMEQFNAIFFDAHEHVDPTIENVSPDHVAEIIDLVEADEIT